MGAVGKLVMVMVGGAGMLSSSTGQGIPGAML